MAIVRPPITASIDANLAFFMGFSPSVGQGAQVLFPSDRAPCRTEENGPAGQSLFGSAMAACSGTRSCPPTIVRSADRVGYTERIFFDEQVKFLVRPKTGAAPSRGAMGVTRPRPAGGIADQLAIRFT